ncbi:origin recognition complex subunit 5 [Bacillus rossius redtenbacheri]|uniref:origin recognition complex subunit 5 n=1 Tax=Bacillus rossius redtenbacheri TaxID=93214 RepID=UPI002FDE7E1B
MMEVDSKFVFYNRKTILLNMQHRQKLKVLVKDKLSSTNPCRESEIDTLMGLLVMHYMPSSIFIYGHTATGKTHTVKNILQELNYANAYVNCIECYSPKLMYQQILHDLFDDPEQSILDSIFTCDNMMDFVTHLEQNASCERIFKEPYVIVFDNCENLRNMDGTFLSAVLRLQEFTKLNLCVILIAGISWDKFYSKVNCEVPIIVHFRQYTKDELLELLLLDVNADPRIPRHLYRAFLQLVLAVCCRYCCSLVELRHVARTTYRKLCDPAEECAPESLDVKKMWVKIKPHLEASVNKLYMRAAGEWDSGPARCDQNQLAVSLNLPYFTKYMLIAAYLASYNPAASDKRMFVKHHGKERKRLQRPRKGSAIGRNLRQPDSFTSDRLLAIYYSIVEDKVGLSTALLAQISTLVKLRLLIQDNEDCLTSTYRCAVSLDFITAIGRNVDFNVLKYLYSKD